MKVYHTPEEVAQKTRQKERVYENAVPKSTIMMPATQNYIYDLDTPNISFIQTAIDLKNLGIEENMFFLRLYDPLLKGIDPHDPFLTEEYQLRVTYECVINPWYYLREVARIPDTGSVNGIRYELNRANLATTWCILHGIDSYTVIPRQTGKTQSTIAIILWAFQLGSANTEIAFLNIDMTKSKENMDRLRKQRDLLPKYLQGDFAVSEDGTIEKGRDSATIILNRNTQNSIIPKGKAMSREAAETIGRGNTQAIQLYDEFDFMNENKTIMEAAGPAFATASRNAKKNGSMYARIFISTPGDLDSKAGADALKVIKKCAIWTEKLYDMSMNAVREYLEDSENQIMYIEYSYMQLGKDQAWFKEVCRVVNNEPLKIKREILLQRMRGSSESPYDPNDLAMIEEYRGTIRDELFIYKSFRLVTYAEIEKNKIYFIGVDVANGYGEDNSAITIWDPYTMKTVAEMKSPFISVPDLMKLLYSLVKNRIPQSLLIVERNANGEAIIASLLQTDIRRNIYYDNSKDGVEETLINNGTIESRLAQEAKRRKNYGVWTGTASRQRMFALLDNHIKDYKDRFIGHYIIDDIFALVRSKTGKIVAGEGFHDDNIMSFLMCLYVYYFGTNLLRYGFSRTHNIEDLNPNLYDEDNILDLMSEGDKRFFSNIDLEEQQYDMQRRRFNQTQIQRTAFINQEELTERNIIQTNPDYVPIRNSYDARLYDEMRRAQAESEYINSMVQGRTATVQSLDGGPGFGNDNIDLSLFDYLNDIH